MEQNEPINNNAQTPRIPKSVCILGAGISGLATAYYLMINSQSPLMINIFEIAPEVGGNCRTYKLDMGGNTRWADMGVNDYNKSSYKYLNDLMEKTGYVSGNPLEDTELYFSMQNDLLYTNDGNNFTPMPADVAKSNKYFIENAYTDSLNKDFRNSTLAEYLRARADFYSHDFIYYNLYPRVNAMYFCGGNPGEMSFRGIMNYYHLQEGYSSNATPNRQYFKEGSKTWIDSLVTLLDAVAKEKNHKYKLETDVRVKVEYDFVNNQLKIAGDRTGTYEAVVLSMAANDAVDCLPSSPFEPVRNVLRGIPYIKDSAVVHTDTSSLPARLNSWRTYNVQIFADDDYNEPYSITYVGNRHQNDAANPGLKCGTPQFLISMNPTKRPEYNSIVRMTNGAPARTEFWHQKLSVASMATQEKIDTIQGDYYLYFANGYAIGAGLHEECLMQAEYVARKMLGLPPKQQLRFNYAPGAKQFAPDYLLAGLKKTINK